MHIGKVRVANYRCLKGVEIPLSHFSTLIGENNSGKSSALQTLILFTRGTKLSQADFYDSRCEIAVSVTLEDVSDDDLEVLAQEHRERIEQLLDNKTLRLVRRYNTDGTSTLRCVRPLPKDERFRPEKIATLLKGLSGSDLKKKVEEIFPELAGKLNATTQTAAKQRIEELANSLPPEQITEQEVDLPTGIENSIKALLPEPVYIPAVKELSDDVKTRESASFGRLLSILLNVIEPKLGQVEETFANLNEKLNKIKRDGNIVDNRLDEVKEIERTVEAYVRENFPSVSIEIQIPPPEIKTVLSTAKILVNDGVEGLVDSKGDGLKRAVTFAILRAYVSLSAKPEWQKDTTKSLRPAERYCSCSRSPNYTSTLVHR